MPLLILRFSPQYANEEFIQPHYSRNLCIERPLLFGDVIASVQYFLFKINILLLKCHNLMRKKEKVQPSQIELVSVVQC